MNISTAVSDRTSSPALFPLGSSDWAWIGDRIGKAIQDTIIGIDTVENNMDVMNADLVEFFEENGYID